MNAEQLIAEIQDAFKRLKSYEAQIGIFTGQLASLQAAHRDAVTDNVVLRKQLNALQEKFVKLRASVLAIVEHAEEAEAMLK